MSVTAAIYVRISTTLQKTDMQERESIKYCNSKGWKYRIYQDHASGAKESRPELAQLIADATEGEINVVVVWSLDRLGRSLKHLLTLTELFRDLGVDFVCVKQSIDTSTPAGRLTYQVLGAVAEFEREMLRERVRAGLANAKRKGRISGRPPRKRFTEAECVEIRTDHANGKSVRKLASELGTTDYMIAKIVAATKPSEKQNFSGARK